MAKYFHIAIIGPMYIDPESIVQIAANYQIVPPSELNRPDFRFDCEGCDWVQNRSVFIE